MGAWCRRCPQDSVGHCEQSWSSARIDAAAHGKGNVMKGLTRIALSIVAAGWSCTVNAQNYPERPVRMIVSIAAGSVTDVIMRGAVQELQPRLGQPIIIENRGGAAGILGGQACAQATPDGYTICVIYHNTLSYNPLLFSKLPYDADKDFVPITRLFFLVEGVFVSADSHMNSVADLKKMAQTESAKLNFGTLGEGSSPDLFLRWMNNQWHSQIVGIPYKGGGPAAQALAANDIQLTRFGVGNFKGLVDAGRVKALSVNSAERSPLLPDVPTDREVGWGDFPARGWWGLAAPKGTPPQIIAKLNDEFVRLFNDPKFVAFLQKNFVVSAPTSPEGFTAFLKEDRKAAEALIKIANAKSEEYDPAHADH
jgi:tripartite-type tricarboxylate transporter receptor subunit TctC